MISPDKKHVTPGADTQAFLQYDPNHPDHVAQFSRETIENALRLAPYIGSGALQATVSRHERETKVEVASAEAPSPLHTDHSDDRLLVSPQGYLGVFDGVGGNAGSERAAEIAAMAMDNHLSGIDTSQGTQHVMQRLDQAIRMTDSAIKRYNEANATNTATTLAIGMVVPSDDRKQLVWASVGDSRIGVFNSRRGTYRNLSLDETLENLRLPQQERWKRQQKFDTASTAEDFAALSNQEMAAYKSQMILHALGGDIASELQIGVVDLDDGDEIVAMTDGIVDNLSGPDMLQLLQKGGSLTEKTERIDEQVERTMLDPSAVRRKQDDRALAMIRV